MMKPESRLALLAVLYTTLLSATHAFSELAFEKNIVTASIVKDHSEGEFGSVLKRNIDANTEANYSKISQYGNSNVACIDQRGSGNSALIMQTNSGATAAIYQQGSSNRAAISQR